MGEFRMRWQEMSVIATIIAFTFLLVLVFVSVSIDRNLISNAKSLRLEGSEENIELDYYFLHVRNFLWKSGQAMSYEHVWPEMKVGWRMIVGTIIGFFGAALGSGGGVGGGGIFVPMLTLIVGFDSKSSAPVSKCMIVAAALSTVYYNLKRKHPTLDMPIIDYNLVVLVQPMLMLGVSIGVGFNMIFPDWMVTVLLIMFFLGTSTVAFFKGVETWKKETKLKKEGVKCLESNGVDSEEVGYRPLPSCPREVVEERNSSAAEVPIIENVRWKALILLVFVWVSFLAIQITKSLGNGLLATGELIISKCRGMHPGWARGVFTVKETCIHWAWAWANNTPTCSTTYWVLNLLQIPISLGVTLYEAVSLYTGKKVVACFGEGGGNIKAHQLALFSFFGLLAGMIGGMLGLAGGFLLGPLFLELGIPPEVASATTTFAITFSASMSVVEYYLLDRFPVPYALYFVVVATIAAFVGQRVVRKMIIALGRTSIIIFILSFIIFVSGITLGGVGIINMIRMIERHEYMGFENLCKLDG